MVRRYLSFNIGHKTKVRTLGYLPAPAHGLTKPLQAVFSSPSHLTQAAPVANKNPSAEAVVVIKTHECVQEK